MDTGIFVNGLAAVGYLVMDVVALVLLMGMMIWAAYRRDPYPNDNSRPHNTR